MYIFPYDQLKEFLSHVDRVFPKEASGLLLGNEFKQFTILSFVADSCSENTACSFRIKAETMQKVARSLRGSTTKLLGCAHSHPKGAAFPSPMDREGATDACFLWMIYSVRRRELNLFEWDKRKFNKVRFRIIR